MCKLFYNLQFFVNDCLHLIKTELFIIAIKYGTEIALDNRYRSLWKGGGSK